MSNNQMDQNDYKELKALLTIHWKAFCMSNISNGAKRECREKREYENDENFKSCVWLRQLWVCPDCYLGCIRITERVLTKVDLLKRDVAFKSEPYLLFPSPNAPELNDKNPDLQSNPSKHHHVIILHSAR